MIREHSTCYENQKELTNNQETIEKSSSNSKIDSRLCQEQIKVDEQKEIIEYVMSN